MLTLAGGPLPAGRCPARWAFDERLRLLLRRLRLIRAHWLLFGLQVLLLLCVFLLDLLGLLLVHLFYLLLLRFICILLRQPLVVLFLLLLEFLVVLVLLRVKFVLLLLVLLVRFRVPRVWRSGARMRLEVLGVGCVRRLRNVVLRTRRWRIGGWLSRGTIGRRMIRRSCLFGRYDCRVLKGSRFRSSSYRRLALVRGSP